MVILSETKVGIDVKTVGMYCLMHCAKCNESNHVTARCKHAGQVQCRKCGKLGHKEKHHAWD